MPPVVSTSHKKKAIKNSAGLLFSSFYCISRFHEIHHDYKPEACQNYQIYNTFGIIFRRLIAAENVSHRGHGGFSGDGLVGPVTILGGVRFRSSFSIVARLRLNLTIRD